LLLSGETSSVIATELLSAATAIQVEYDMPALELEGLADGALGAPVCRVSMGDLANSAVGVGGELLPYTTAEIVVPYGTDVADVTVTVDTDDLTIFNNVVALEVATEAISFDRRNPSGTFTVGSATGLFEVVTTQMQRGVEILVVNLFPVHYRPQYDRVLSLDAMLLNVALTPEVGTLGDGSVIDYRVDTIDPLIDEVDNPNALASYAQIAQPLGGAPLSSLVDPADSYDYLIITSDTFVGATADYTLEDFVTHKEALGFSVTTVTVEDIYANYTGADNPEQIRNFIIDAYNGWEVDYVLMAGDHSVVPTRHLWVYGISPDYIDSDFYYQCLDGTFDGDGDGNYGEYGEDSVDFYAEVYIGRAAFDNVTRMSNWVYKTITYEDSLHDDYRYNAEMVGEWLASGAGVTEYAKESLEEIRTWYFNLDPDFNVDTLYAKDQGWSSGTIINHINTDQYAIFNHIGHGNGDIVMQTSSGSYDSGLTNDNFFFLYSQACWPGYMRGESVAEHLTTYTRHGAAAAVLNSSYGWFYYNYTGGPSHILNRQFWDAFFNEGLNEFGAMNADSHEDNMGQIGTAQVRAVVYCTTLYGDPSLAVAPMDLAVMIGTPDLGFTGESYNFDVDAKNGTAPYTFTISDGALPPGLTIATDTGLVSGSPTATGEYTFTVQVVDDVAALATREFRIPVVDRLAITTAPALPDATDGYAYSTFVAATGGTTPYTYTLAAGALPGGLSLNGTTGEISGLSSDVGVHTFTIEVADSDPTYGQTDQVEFNLEVVQVPSEIYGQVFLDDDGNGVREGAERGINGLTVELYDLDGATVVATTTSADMDLNGDETILLTTETGCYHFVDLPAGNYEIRISPYPDDLASTTTWQDPDSRTFAAEANEDNTVTIFEFDSTDGSTLNSFAGPASVQYQGLQGMAVGPDSLFYVDANDMLAPTLYELDLDTGAVLDSDALTFGAVYAIRGLAYLDGNLYIQYLANAVAVWDPATDALLQTLAIAGDASGGLTAAHDLDVLFASNGSGQVLKIDPADGTVLATYDTGLATLNGGLAYADGELLGAAVDAGSSVYRIDPADGSVLGYFDVGTGMNEVVGLAGDALPTAVPGIIRLTLAWDEIIIGQNLGNQYTPGLAGDMDSDGDVDAADIDLLGANVGLAPHPKFDLDSDGDADADDLAVLVESILNTRFGDVNLDGTVDATDLLLLANNYGQLGGWADGDLNCDGTVTATDLALMQNDYGYQRTGGELAVTGYAMLADVDVRVDVLAEVDALA